jgi:hypothetical protein
MSKQHQHHVQQGDDDAVVMWAEHRDEPDWDKLVAVVIAMALAEAEEDRQRGRRD